MANYMNMHVANYKFESQHNTNPSVRRPGIVFLSKTIMGSYSSGMEVSIMNLAIHGSGNPSCLDRARCYTYSREPYSNRYTSETSIGVGTEYIRNC